MPRIPFRASQVRNLAALDTTLTGSPMPTDFKLTSDQFCDHLRKVRTPPLTTPMHVPSAPSSASAHARCFTPPLTRSSDGCHHATECCSRRRFARWGRRR